MYCDNDDETEIEIDSETEDNVEAIDCEDDEQDIDCDKVDLNVETILEVKKRKTCESILSQHHS